MMVEQATRGRDQHVDAACKFGVLITKRNAPDDEGDIKLVIDTVFDEAFLDLRGEFARGLEDECAWHPRPRPALFEPRQHRQHECGGLAGTSLRNAKNVATCQHVRDSLFLDGGGGRVTSRGNRGDNFFGQAEIGKRHYTSE